jgi:pSer/pThr/pTyr-binding forkhead associated (FHA) protein
MSGESVGPGGAPPEPGPGSPGSPTEQASIQSAESRTSPFVVYRDVNGRQRIYELPESGQVTIGRGLWTDISLNWDEATSRLHARLESLSDDWTVVDDGTSRNGTFLNGERVEGRRRLGDGDELLIGGVTLSVHMPGRVDEGATAAFKPGELPLDPDAQV